MYKLYNDTENELYYEKDYKTLPNLESLNCTETVELLENLYNAFENACTYGSSLLETALYDDIAAVNRKRCFDYLLTVSPGHLATVISNTKYTEIDKAISVSWQYFNSCDDDIFFEIGTGVEGIENLVKYCYHPVPIDR
jgi:hypothetical protein